MLPRDRVFAALDLEEPDRVPMTEVLIDPPIVEKVTGRPIKGWVGSSLTIATSEEDLGANIRNLVRCYDKLGLDMVVVHWLYLKPLRWRPEYLEDTVVDEWGVKWYVSPNPWDKRSGQYAGGIIASPEDLETFELPDPHDNGQVEAAELAMKIVKREVGEEKAVGLQIHDCFTRCWMMRGMSNFLLDLYKNKTFAERLLEHQTKYFIEVGKAAIDAGAEIIFSGDDYCDSHGPFMHPRLFRRFMSSHVKRWVEDLKKRGAQFIVKHCDGDLSPIIEDFIEAGFDGIHPLEGMDLKEAKEEFGDTICLMGRVDSAHILPNGTLTEVKEEVKASINNLSPGGGHILLSSNSIHKDCKVENVWAMTKEARKYGVYPLRRS